MWDFCPPQKTASVLQESTSFAFCCASSSSALVNRALSQSASICNTSVWGHPRIAEGVIAQSWFSDFCSVYRLPWLAAVSAGRYVAAFSAASVAVNAFVTKIKD